MAAVERGNGGPDVINLSTTGDSPDTEQPEVHGTSGSWTPKAPWEKGKPLGRGSFGTVFKAKDIDGREFAVKEVCISEPSNKARRNLAKLEKEVGLLKKFKHPNIVQYLGTEKSTDAVYIFMELVENGSLSSLYQESNFELTDLKIKAFAKDLLTGLTYLHGQRIIHRDIKCANILVDKDGTCKLADFDVAKQFSTLDPNRTCVGSFCWMAPEVLNSPGEETYGPPADIWSFGCSVLEMVTKARPFAEISIVEAVSELRQGNAPPIPHTLSNSLQDFLKCCFQKDPKERPTTLQLLHHPFIVQDCGVSANSGPSLLAHSVTNQERLIGVARHAHISQGSDKLVDPHIIKESGAFGEGNSGPSLAAHSMTNQESEKPGDPYILKESGASRGGVSASSGPSLAAHSTTNQERSTGMGRHANIDQGKGKPGDPYIVRESGAYGGVVSANSSPSLAAHSMTNQESEKPGDPYITKESGAFGGGLSANSGLSLPAHSTTNQERSTSVARHAHISEGSDKPGDSYIIKESGAFGGGVSTNSSLSLPAHSMTNQERLTGMGQHANIDQGSGKPRDPYIVRESGASGSETFGSETFGSETSGSETSGSETLVSSLDMFFEYVSVRDGRMFRLAANSFCKIMKFWRD